MITSSIETGVFEAATQEYARVRIAKLVAKLGINAVQEALEYREYYKRLSSGDPDARTPLDAYEDEVDQFHGHTNDLLGLDRGFQITDVAPGLLVMESKGSELRRESLHAGVNNEGQVEISKRIYSFLTDASLETGIRLTDDPAEPSPEEVALIARITDKLSGLALYLSKE